MPSATPTPPPGAPLSRRRLLAAGAGLVVADTVLHPGRAGAVAAVAPGPVRFGPAEVFPRSTWGADLPAKGPIDAEQVRFLLVHHTASRNDYDEAGAIADLRSFYGLHTGPEKGWPMIREPMSS